MIHVEVIHLESVFHNACLKCNLRHMNQYTLLILNLLKSKYILLPRVLYPLYVVYMKKEKRLKKEDEEVLDYFGKDNIMRGTLEH